MGVSSINTNDWIKYNEMHFEWGNSQWCRCKSCLPFMLYWFQSMWTTTSYKWNNFYCDCKRRCQLFLVLALKENIRAVALTTCITFNKGDLFDNCPWLTCQHHIIKCMSVKTICGLSYLEYFIFNHSKWMFAIYTN